MGLKNTRLVNLIGIFCSFFLVAFVTVFIFAPVDNSNAADGGSCVNLHVGTVLSAYVEEDTVEATITPGDNAWNLTNTEVYGTVNTNNQYGFTVTMGAKDDKTYMESATTPDRVNSIDSQISIMDIMDELQDIHDNCGDDEAVCEEQIANAQMNFLSTEMGNNTWGYANDGPYVKPIPTASLPDIIESSEYAATYDSSFGVYLFFKIDQYLSAGTYERDLVFTAYANDPESSETISTPECGAIHVNKLSLLTSMQDSNLGQYCAETYTPTKDAREVTFDDTFYRDLVPRAVLTDTRDGNKYLVSKLADGNCWMSQNLALDLSTNKTLTKEDTGFTSSRNSWTPEEDTQTEGGAGLIHSPDTAKSYHPQADEAYYRGGITKSSTPTTNEDKYLYEKAGNLYNWYAATAGSGTASETLSANDSICPGPIWELPGYSGKGSYNYLIDNVYDLADSSSSYLTLRQDPFNFILAGEFDYRDGLLAWQGSTGDYWTARASSADYAYHLSIGSWRIYLDNGLRKGNGASVRCIVYIGERVR